jgi:hypothetical protein
MPEMNSIKSHIVYECKGMNGHISARCWPVLWRVVMVFWS